MHKLYTMTIVHQTLKQALSFFFNKSTDLLNIYVLEFVLHKSEERNELGLSDDVYSALQTSLNQHKHRKYTFNNTKWADFVQRIGASLAFLILLFIIPLLWHNDSDIINWLDLHLTSLGSLIATLILDYVALMLFVISIYLGIFQIVSFVKRWFSDTLYITIFDDTLHTNYAHNSDITKLLTKYDYDRYQHYYEHHLLPDNNVITRFLKPQNFLLVKTCNSFLIFNKQPKYRGFYNTICISDVTSSSNHFIQIFNLILSTLFILIFAFFQVFFFALSYIFFPIFLIIGLFDKRHHTNKKKSALTNYKPITSFISPLALFTVINRKDINEKDFFNKYSFKYIASYDPNRGLISKSWDDDQNG